MSAKRHIIPSVKQILDLFKKTLYYDQWSIGIIDEPVHVFLQQDARPAVRWLPISKDAKYIADPFAVSVGERDYIFYEEYDYRISKGYISVMNIHGDDTYSQRDIFHAPFHMSYPYIVKYKDRVYCIPETCEANEISLYAADEFPLKWAKVCTLVENFAGIDSTVFQYDKYWWLLSAENESGKYRKLYVWYANDLFDTWRPHALNPVKIDPCSSRPAGTPFLYEGDLYRPAQDCSEAYGRRIVLNRITRLTPAEFGEQQEAIIEPYFDSQFPDGIHTVSAFGDKTIIDGKRRVFIGNSFYMVLYKLRMFRKILSFLHNKN